MEKKQLKVGVFAGDGPPPGYSWNVFMIDFVHDEVMAFLNPAQYDHLALQFKQLASEQDPSHPVTVSVDKVGDFYELRDKGGVLGKINVRIFFHIDSDSRSMIVLGGIKKENNGPTPEGTKITIGRRRRKFIKGDYGKLPA